MNFNNNWLSVRCMARRLIILALTLLLTACAMGSPSTLASPVATPEEINESSAPAPQSTAQVEQHIAVKEIARPRHDNDIEFEHIPPEAGLSQSVVQTFLQDRYGFLWMGTQDGLNRYDGYQFKIFKHDPDDPNSLSDNSISSIAEDQNGNLWIATSNGLNLYDQATGRFTPYFNDPDDSNSLSNSHITALAVDKDGGLWIGTGAGLNRRMPDKPTTGSQEAARFQRFFHDEKDLTSLSESQICSLFVDRQGTLWIGTPNGLDYFDPDTNVFVHFKSDKEEPDSLPGGEIEAISEDSQGNIWVGASSGGLARFDKKAGRFTHYVNDPENPRSLSSNSINSIYLDRQGRLWIGTNVGGLNLLDSEADGFIHYKNDPSVPTSLSNDQIYSIYQDAGGVLWFGTFGSGVDKYDPSKEKFPRYRYNPQDPDSVSSNFIWDMDEDSQGIVWIGTIGGGLNRFDPTTGKSSKYTNNPQDPNSISGDQVWTVFVDQDDRVWVGTGVGLDRLDPKTAKFEHFDSPPVWAILRASDGNYWMGTHGYGITTYNSKMEPLNTYKYEEGNPNSLGDDSITTIIQDSQGDIWIGTFNNGVTRYNPESKQFTRYSNDPDDPQSLSHNCVLTVYQDSQGRYWIGTVAGLDLLTPQTGKIKHYREKDGLPNNFVYGILEDDQGNLWLSTNVGLSRFDPKNNTFQNFDRLDGLQSNEFNQASNLKTRNGEMYFGGINGFNAFYPDQIQENTYTPPVRLTSFQISNEPVAVGGGSSLDKTLEETSQVELNYEQNNLTFEYAALDFGTPQKIQYAYMLGGYDKDWNQVGNRRFASYPRLPAGDYTFKVKATNGDGVWGTNPVEINIIVTPPFWQTWWFRGMMGLLVVGAVVSVFGLRVRAIESRRRNLEDQVQQRTRELTDTLEELKISKEAAEAASRAKSSFLANISHELRTPLNAILGFSQLMIHSADGQNEGVLTSEQRRNLEVINRSGEHLLGLINDVLEMSKIEAGRMTINMQSFDLHHLLDGLEEMFRLRAEAKGLSLTFERSQDVARYVYADEGKLRQIMMNLLGNAIKFTQHGRVILRTRLQALDPNNPITEVMEGYRPTHMLRFEVEDTGVGIATEELKQVFNPFVQTASGRQAHEGTGLGLTISRQYARMMGGDIQVESQLNNGSLFVFEAPIRVVDPATARARQYRRHGIGLEPDQPVYRLLIVDDKDVNRNLLVSILQPYGFDLREATDGQQAIEIWRQWQPHLIWMDMRMPVMDGYEATRRIKTDPLGKDTVIIALTASALEEDREVILAEGCDDYIRKPFRDDDLLEALATHLGVKFIYEEPDSMTVASEFDELSLGKLPAEKIVDRLAILPAEQVNELRQATVLGYWDSVRQIVGKIAEQDIELGESLAALVASYDQNRILSLIEQLDRNA